MCGKSFIYSLYLTQHQRIYFREKPYRCDKCGRGFCLNSQLGQHQRSYSMGKKPYKCSTIGSASARASTIITTTESPLVRNSMDVISVGKPFVKLQILFSIRKFILERNSLYYTARAAIKEYHTLGDLNNRNFILSQFWGLENVRSRCSQFSSW